MSKMVNGPVGGGPEILGDAEPASRRREDHAVRVSWGSRRAALSFALDAARRAGPAPRTQATSGRQP